MVVRPGTRRFAGRTESLAATSRNRLRGGSALSITPPECETPLAANRVPRQKVDEMFRVYADRQSVEEVATKPHMKRLITRPVILLSYTSVRGAPLSDSERGVKAQIGRAHV